MKKKILIVEDESHIVEMLTMSLKQNNYLVNAVNNGDEVLAKIETFKPDCVLLDIMLPGKSGYEVCREVKATTRSKNLPIIMLTAKGEEDDKVLGLRIGADDYITKPFSLKELFARIEAVLRRSVTVNETKTNKTTSDFKVDLDKYQVSFKNQVLTLTPSEFKIIKLLIENQDKVVERSFLIKTLEIKNDNKAARSLDVHIRNIRTKLIAIDPKFDGIKTLKSIGFMLHA